jgi:hypothetical protein
MSGSGRSKSECALVVEERVEQKRKWMLEQMDVVKKGSLGSEYRERSRAGTYGVTSAPGRSQ